MYYFDIMPEKNHTPIPSFLFIKALVRDVFGSYFIENNIWLENYDYSPMGRTFFDDRKKQKCAVNDKASDNIQFLYQAVFHRQTTYDPKIISQKFTQSMKNNFQINVDYLMFFDDDTEILRNAKIMLINQLVCLLLGNIRGKEFLESCELDDRRVLGSSNKMWSYIIGMVANTYTEQVLKEIHDQRVKEISLLRKGKD